MILVSGGSGAMGSRLVRRLVEKGKKIRVLTLPNDPLVTRLSGLNCEIFYGDISDASSLKGAFDGVETVYHLAAIIIAYDPSFFEKININGTRNMIQGSIAAGVKHFVLISSASVVYATTNEYARSKQVCERMIKEQKEMQYTIIRPTLAYEKDGGQEFMMFLEYLKKYPIVPFVGRGDAPKNPVHVDDLIKGFVAVEGNPKAFGKTYNFSGGEEITIWEQAKLMLKHQGMNKIFVPLPVWLCKLLAAVMERVMARPPLTQYAIARIVQDANLDHSSATEDLGYRPVGFREGLQKCFPIQSQVESHALKSVDSQEPSQPRAPIL
jgi:nucleoside-diphosphate-sugar epimerase